MESKVEEAQAESVTREFSFSDAKALAPGPAEDAFSSQDTCRSAGYMRRKSSTALLALERLVRSRERVWSTTLSTLIASITMLLCGFTFGFPSVSVLYITAGVAREPTLRHSSDQPLCGKCRFLCRNAFAQL